MKTVKIDLPRELEYLRIYTFADWHIGDAHCDMKRITQDIESVKADEHTYCVLNGDICNNAVKTGASDVYSESIKPMEQLKRACELLEPIKDKILLISQGNHEARTYRNDGIDLTALICRELDIDDRYVAEGGVLFLRFGQNNRKEHKSNEIYRRLCYSLYMTHGSGGGRKEGGKVNRLADLASIIDTDVYIHSHTHLPVVMKESFFRIDAKNSAVAQVEKLFVNTAATLGYGGYGQTFGFKPSSTATPIILLSGIKKQMTATL